MSRVVGRPKKPFDRKKKHFVSLRYDQELSDILYYLRSVTGMNNSEIIREGIRKVFDEVKNG